MRVETVTVTIPNGYYNIGIAYDEGSELIIADTNYSKDFSIYKVPLSGRGWSLKSNINNVVTVSRNIKETT